MYEILREWEHDSQDVKFFLRHANHEIHPEPEDNYIPHEPNSVDLSSDEPDDYSLEVDGNNEHQAT